MLSEEQKADLVKQKVQVSYAVGREGEAATRDILALVKGKASEGACPLRRWPANADAMRMRWRWDGDGMRMQLRGWWSTRRPLHGR